MDVRELSWGAGLAAPTEKRLLRFYSEIATSGACFKKVCGWRNAFSQKEFSWHQISDLSFGYALNSQLVQRGSSTSQL